MRILEHIFFLPKGVRTAKPAMLLLALWMLAWAVARKFFRQRNTSRTSQPKRILFVAVGGLGDALMIIPVVRLLREAEPDAEITLATASNSAGKEIYAALPALYNRLEIYDAEPKSWHEAMQQNRQWIERDFDEVLVSYISSFGIFYVLPALVSGTRQRIMLVDEHYMRSFYQWLFSEARVLNRKAERRSEIEMHSDLLSSGLGGLGITATPDRTWTLPVRDAAKLAATEWLKSQSLWDAAGQQAARFVLVHAGSFQQQDYKRYPVEKYAAVIDALWLRGFKAVVIGTPAERESFERLRSLCTAPLTACFGLELFTVCAIIEHAALFIGNDSGLGHLSILFNRPTVRIFGPSYYYGFRAWKPGPFKDVFQPLECTPCLRLAILETKGLNAYTCGHRACLADISARTVLEAVADVLPEKIFASSP
ncbi:MAG: glycosyltransferase family 9 protein [Rhizobacter sp.]|nr:glycosyltransferase family 9 protein [Chlorobiales bacterium]